jgi:hypothetical protein
MLRPLIEEAWVSRAVEERARLIAEGKERYRDLFGSFVTGLQRVMCGLPRCPGQGTEPLPLEEGFVPLDTIWSGRCSMSHSANLWDGVLFDGSLHFKPLAGGEHTQTNVWFKVKDLGEGNAHLNISVHQSTRCSLSNEDLAAALGILLAFRTEVPEALVQGGRNPLPTTMRLWGWLEGLQGTREVQDLVAPLRCLARSIIIDHNIKMGPPTVGREVQSRPLGILDVRATVAACNQWP